MTSSLWSTDSMSAATAPLTRERFEEAVAKMREVTPTVACHACIGGLHEDRSACGLCQGGRIWVGR